MTTHVRSCIFYTCCSAVSTHIETVLGHYIVSFCRELGENMTDEELRAMIDEFDRDGDGESKNAVLIHLTNISSDQVPWSLLYFGRY